MIKMKNKSTVSFFVLLVLLFFEFIVDNEIFTNFKSRSYATRFVISIY